MDSGSRWASSHVYSQWEYLRTRLSCRRARLLLSPGIRLRYRSEREGSVKCRRPGLRPAARRIPPSVAEANAYIYRGGANTVADAIDSISHEILHHNRRFWHRWQRDNSEESLLPIHQDMSPFIKSVDEAYRIHQSEIDDAYAKSRGGN